MTKGVKKKNGQPTELLETSLSCACHNRETIQMNKMCVNMCYCVTVQPYPLFVNYGKTMMGKGTHSLIFLLQYTEGVTS